MAVDQAPALRAGDVRSSLATGWELLRAGPGSICGPESLPTQERGWVAAIVPGTVACSLRAAKNQATNGVDAADAVDAYDWWYRCEFSWAADGARVSLALDGLATIADVWLNGTMLLHSDNMFVSHLCDVSPLLKSDNEIVIRFASLRSALHGGLRARLPRPRWKTRLVAEQGLRWVRTTLLGHIPGWAAGPKAVGPWREVALVRHGEVSVTECWLRPTVDGSSGLLRASLRIRVPDGARIMSAALLVANVSAPMAISVDGDDRLFAGAVTIPHAELWWPHTHGTQPTYAVSLQVECNAGSITLPLGRVGFRTIELVTVDGGFAFHVNGQSIFCRGACWSTLDPVTLTGTRESYLDALTLARDAGMNMIRIGGTMLYEADVFYDVCDELGIMVWQDLIFANMDYPEADAGFVESVTAEVTQVLHRIGAHPALALLCGNSEVEQQAALMGLPRGSWSGTLFSNTIPSLMAQLRPDLAYWQSTPGGGVLPFQVDSGDAHYFGFGPYLRPMSDVRASGVRFASECLALSNIPEPSMVDSLSCGSAGAGHHPVWKAGVPRDSAAGFDFEDVRDHYVADLFKLNPLTVRYADPERYLTLGRVAGGELMARTLAEWRRAESPCKGALVWLYRDLVPGAGWGLLDVSGEPKAAYYYFRRASLPVAIFFTDEGLNGLKVHVANDTADDVDAVVRITLYRDGRSVVGHGRRALTIPAATTIALSADELLTSFTDISFAYRFGPANHDLVVATIVSAATGARIGDAFHFPLGLSSVCGPIDLSAVATSEADGAYALTLRSGSLATAVAIEARGFRPEDNYFHLEPGVDRSIQLVPRKRGIALRGRITSLNGAGPVQIELR